jgi:amino acid adenylation domain-containing protein
MITAMPSAGAETAGLASGFLRSRDRFPDRPALEVEGTTLTYAELHGAASRVAHALAGSPPADEAPVVAVFAARSRVAFMGVLGALLSGRGYVALNRTFPIDRTRYMLEHSGARAVVVDAAAAADLDALLDGVATPLLVLLPEQEDVAALQERWPLHTILGRDDLADADVPAPVVEPDGTAYLIYTSGSTGTPKAVQVLHRNVRHYLDFITRHLGLTETDKVSQTFEMTFDVSVNDLFAPWECGACVCCPSRNVLLKPGKWIVESGLTVWYSVPSLGLLMKRLGMLRPDAYPALRLALFAGEALPRDLAQAWVEAAPNGRVENLYGPTEVTITCMYYPWDALRSPDECEQGVAPIGWANTGLDALVVDESLHEVEPGGLGELLLAGPQVTAGYWNDPAKTEAAFVRVPGRDETFYRTGDRVRRPQGDAPMPYLGRVDRQVKINGYRVELGEIESALRDATGIGEVVALGWPRTETGGYSGAAAFLQAEELDVPSLQEKLRARLPEYMVPRLIVPIAEIPLGPSGKFDRNALVGYLEAM